MSLTNIDEKLLDLPPQSGEPVTEDAASTPAIAESITPETPVDDHQEVSYDQNSPSTPNKDQAQPDVDAFDDYGNKIEKKERIYTQSEVNEMIRDRLSRGQYAQPTTPEPQYAPANPAQPAAAEDWQTELEQFTLQTLEKRERAMQEQRWQSQQKQIQADFEMKFTASMAKYPDFEQTIQGKGISPDMVIATRAMQDPAAFLYAAAKSQPAELSRISAIPDKLAQAVEIGKLEERMRKATKKTTSAPAPISSTTSDVASNNKPGRNIDEMIRQHNKQK